MLPAFLLPDQVSRESGRGPALELGAARGKTLQLTLGITRIIEQECLEIAILSSQDGESWKERPIVSFPQKFYCGQYSTFLDLAKHSDARFIRAEWNMRRWDRGEPAPLFAFYIKMEEAKVAAAVA